MSVSELTLDDVDLENDVFAERVPHETFALLRREAPVHWYDWPHGKGFWCITKHADLVAVHKDTENPNRLVFVEQWASEEALWAHFKVPDSRAFAKELATLAAEPPSIAVYRASPVQL